MSATKKAEIMEKVQASRSPIRQVLRQSGGSSTSTTIAGTTRHSRTSPRLTCWPAEGKKSSAGEVKDRTINRRKLSNHVLSEQLTTA